MVLECPSTYGVEGDVSNQIMDKLASELASKRMISADDITRAMKVEPQDMLESGKK